MPSQGGVANAAVTGRLNSTHIDALSKAKLPAKQNPTEMLESKGPQPAAGGAAVGSTLCVLSSLAQKDSRSPDERNPHAVTEFDN